MTEWAACDAQHVCAREGAAVDSKPIPITKTPHYRDLYRETQSLTLRTKIFCGMKSAVDAPRGLLARHVSCQP